MAFWASVLALHSASAVRADDSSSGVALPGLSSEPVRSVRALNSNILLEGDTVHLRLRLQLPEGGGKLLLRGPLFEWLGDGETYPDRHFPELQARWSGTVLAPDLAFEARIGARDITADVATLRLDPFVIAGTPPLLDPLPAADDPAYKRLLAVKAVQLTDGQPWARWQARRLWRFPLGAAPSNAFELSYRARPRLVLLKAERAAQVVPLARYCVSPALLQKRLARPAGHTGLLVLRAYAIAAGVDGRAGSSLRLKVTAPRAVFCGADGQPVFGAGEPAAARIDKSGVVHVLRLDEP